MSNNLYMPFHTGDYRNDTDHLPTALEHGAYLLLLFSYWNTGRPLPDDDRKLAAIAKVTADEWAIIGQDIREFFQARDGKLYHKRVEEELARAHEKVSSARQSGIASANARRNRKNRSTTVEQSLNERPADDEPPLSERPTTQVQEQDIPIPSELALPPDPSAAETELFRRGREICGKQAGGLIAKVLKAKGGNVSLARAAIETAATKSDPREYLGAVAAARERDGPERSLRERGYAW